MCFSDRANKRCFQGNTVWHGVGTGRYAGSAVKSKGLISDDIDLNSSLMVLAILDYCSHQTVLQGHELSCGFPHQYHNV